MEQPIIRKKIGGYRNEIGTLKNGSFSVVIDHRLKVCNAEWEHNQRWFRRWGGQTTPQAPIPSLGKWLGGQTGDGETTKQYPQTKGNAQQPIDL